MGHCTWFAGMFCFCSSHPSPGARLYLCKTCACGRLLSVPLGVSPPNAITMCCSSTCSDEDLQLYTRFTFNRRGRVVPRFLLSDLARLALPAVCVCASLFMSNNQPEAMRHKSIVKHDGTGEKYKVLKIRLFYLWNFFLSLLLNLPVLGYIYQDRFFSSPLQDCTIWRWLMDFYCASIWNTFVFKSKDERKGWSGTKIV